VSDNSELLALFLYMLLLSFLALGGFSAMLPEMHRYVVEANHWMSDEQFAMAYTIAQLCPGPNALYLTLIGWNVAGWGGAIVATLAMLGPSATITIAVARLHASNPKSPMALALRRGLAPVALGLFLAGGWVLARSVNHDWRGYLLTLIVTIALLRTRLNPLWLLGASGVVGALGWL
jgi:chromate transporter